MRVPHGFLSILKSLTQPHIRPVHLTLAHAWFSVFLTVHYLTPACGPAIHIILANVLSPPVLTLTFQSVFLHFRITVSVRGLHF